MLALAPATVVLVRLHRWLLAVLQLPALQDHPQPSIGEVGPNATAGDFPGELLWKEEDEEAS